MDKVSRRNLLAGATVGAAAVGAGVAIPLINHARSASPTVDRSGSDPIMVYVTDRKSNAITILVGDKLITLNDAALVDRLIQATL